MLAGDEAWVEDENKFVLMLVVQSPNTTHRHTQGRAQQRKNACSSFAPYFESFVGEGSNAPRLFR